MDIKSHEDFIGIYENALTKKECDNIIEIYENTDSVYLEGQSYNDSLFLCRHDFSTNGNECKEVESLILERLGECYEIYSDVFFPIQIINFKFDEIKIQKTPPKGGFYNWHCEIGDISAIDRALTWMIYLNDMPSGEGETEFLWQSIRIQPKAGTCLIWPAFYTHLHRGNPAVSCNKYIATGWGKYMDSRMDEYFVKDENDMYHRKNEKIHT
jgi:hypothetical protein